MRRMLVPLVAASLSLVLAGRAGAQTNVPTLVMTAPADGTTTGPDVTVVVELGRQSAQPVAFEILLDQVPTLLENPGTGQTSQTFTVASGGRTAVILRGIPEGNHTVEAVGVPTGTAKASSIVTFQVSSRGFNLVLLLASVGVLLVFVAYRRRILGPWANRYERRSGEDDSTGGE